MVGSETLIFYWLLCAAFACVVLLIGFECLYPWLKGKTTYKARKSALLAIFTISIFFSATATIYGVLFYKHGNTAPKMGYVSGR